MAMTLAKTAAKVAVGVGAVYVTVDQGVWSTNHQSSKAMTHVRTMILPAANEYFRSIPSADDVNVKAVSTWNSGVQVAFGGLAVAPSKAEEYTNLAIDEVKQKLKS